MNTVRLMMAALAVCSVQGVLAGNCFEMTPKDDAAVCRAKELNALIAKAQPGDEIHFAAGEYRFNEAIGIVGKRGLSLRADKGAVFRARLAADGLATSAIVLFRVRDSADLLLEGFTITTTCTPSATGRVVAIDPSASTYDVRIDDGCDFAGTEPLIIADSCDENGTPDGCLCKYAMDKSPEPDEKGGTRLRQKGIPYEILSERTIRLPIPKDCQMDRFHVGHRMVYRHLVAGGAFSFRNTRRVTVRDVSIERNPSISVVIEPGSADYTFERFAIRPAPGSGAIFASNADGIHVAGMCGTLVLKDCVFEGLGDDPLNVHGKSSEIMEYDPTSERVKCAWQLFHRETHPMSERWAGVGDELSVFDKKTFLERGRVKVVRQLVPGEYVIARDGLSVGVGDILINNRDLPKVRVSGCRVKNVRARGFLLQTHDVTVDNCSFDGVGSVAIMAAPDINNWYESAPTVGLRISGCTFTRCARRSAFVDGVLVKVNHEGPIDAFPAGVHRDISIADCDFSGFGGTNICVASTRGVKVENCRFKGETKQVPVAFVNCEDAAWDGKR